MNFNGRTVGSGGTDDTNVGRENLSLEETDKLNYYFFPTICH